MPETVDTGLTKGVKKRKPRSRTRKILYVALAVLILVALAGGILLNSFPNTIIHYVVEPKLKRLITDRLGQRYSLEMNSITLSKDKDSLILTGVRIVDNGKTASGSSDTSSQNFGAETPLDRLTTDTVMISGLEYWRLVMERGLYAGTISIRSPKIYLRPGSLPKFEKNTKVLPGFLPAVSSKIIKVENAEVYLSEKTPSPGAGAPIQGKDGSAPTTNGVLVKKASIEFHDFYLDETAIENKASTFFCKSATFHAEDISHVDSLGVTDIHVASVDGDLIDSSMTVSSIESTKPIEEVRRVAIDRIEFGGLDWYSALSGHGLHGRSVTIVDPQLYLQDVANISPRPSQHFAASDFIPLPALLPDVTVDDVEIKNAEVYALLPKNKNVSSLKRIMMSFHQLSIDSTTPFTNISRFFSQTASFGIKEESTISTVLGTLHIGAANGTEKSIVVSNIRLDPTLKGLKLVKLKSAEISGLDIWKLLMREGIFASSTSLREPSIYLDDGLAPPITSIDSALGSDPLTFIRGVKQYPLPLLVPTASVGAITISGGSIHGIHSLDDPTNPSRSGDSLNGLKLSLRNFNLNANTWIGKRGMLFSDAGMFSIGSITQHTPGATYRYSERRIEGNLQKHSLTIDSIAIRPLISEDSFGAAFKYRTERLECSAPKVEIAGVDYQDLFLGNGIFADDIFVSDWKLNIYGDRRHPEAPRSARDRFPQELFQEIQMPIDVKHTVAQDGEIRFSESWPDTTVPGTIIGSHINASVGNISNDRSKGDTISTPIEGDLRIMDAGLVKFTILYQLLNPDLTLDVRGTLGSMDPSVFNEYLERTEPFTLRGRVRSAVFNIDLKDSLMTGTITPQYDSLHVTFFKWDKFPPGFVSFFANALIMRSHNIPELDNPLHSAEISTVLDPNVNLFWALWHPIRSGIGSIVRIPEWVW
jgi:hypothetical protein